MRKRLAGVWWSVVAVTLVLLVAMTVQSQAQRGSASDRDLDAIQKLIDRCFEISNDPKLDSAQRARLSQELHRPDTSYAKADLPLYFGPYSNPVARGADEYINSVNTNIDFYREQGYKFETRYDEAQITVERNLAVAVLTPSGVVTSPKGQVLGSRPGRWTIVFQKANDGKWYIAHEHMSFYGPGVGLSDEQLRRKISASKSGS
jgi:ketosteroid isomerase-like protein